MKPLQKKKIIGLLYAGFGAFGITVSMNGGKMTDGAIRIRNKTIKDVEKLLTYTLPKKKKLTPPKIK